jgi:hypothetical protein
MFVYVKNPDKDDKGEEETDVKEKEHSIMNAFGDYMGWQGQFFHVTWSMFIFSSQFEHSCLGRPVIYLCCSNTLV